MIASEFQVKVVPLIKHIQEAFFKSFAYFNGFTQVVIGFGQPHMPIP